MTTFHIGERIDVQTAGRKKTAPGLIIGLRLTDRSGCYATVEYEVEYDDGEIGIFMLENCLIPGLRR